MSLATKILFLGVDAANKFLLQNWAADGTLPTFKSLFARGLVGDTMSLEGFYEGATWPSFYTGVTPAHHGIHSLVQLIPGTYEFYHVYPGDFIKRYPFWKRLSHAGRTVAVLDIPLSGVSQKLKGMQTVEWGSHDSIYGLCTWPPQLKQEIVLRFGHHPLKGSCDFFGRNPKKFSKFRDLLVQGVQKKAALTKYFLNQGSWDFFAQVFSESHCVGHQCWHLHDQNHPRSNPEAAAIRGNPMRDVYQAIDAAIGEILARVDNKTVVVVFVGHCMAHYFGLEFILPEILSRLKVAKTYSEENRAIKSPDLMEKMEALFLWGKRHMPNKIKELLGVIPHRLRDWIDRRQGRPSSMFFAGIDPRKSKCFLLRNGASVCGLRVNLAGREPEGLIQPGAEMEAFCDQLKNDLMHIIDLDIGKPVVKSVKRTADLYQGDYLDHLPDLLVEWSDEKPRGTTATKNLRGSRVRLASDKIGVVEGVNTNCRTGDHNPEGMFIALGPGIKSGRMQRTVSIMDFAPTFCDLLDVKLSDVDGEPITEILEAREGLRLIQEYKNTFKDPTVFPS